MVFIDFTYTENDLKVSFELLLMNLLHDPRRGAHPLDYEDVYFTFLPMIEWLSKRYGIKIYDVLDVGTGKGVFVQACLDRGLNPYGIDLRNIFEGDKSRFVLGDVMELPFKDESFDLVFENKFFDDMRSLQKLTDGKIKRAVDEIHRVLRVGGAIYTIYGDPLLSTRFEVVYNDGHQLYRKANA